MTLKNLKHKETTVALSEIARHNEIVDPDMMNVREVGSYNRPDLLMSIRENGMITPITVVAAKPGQVSNPERKYIPVRGFSRREMLEILVGQYPKGYTPEDSKETLKYDKVKVDLYDIDDPATAVILKMDHSDYRGLSRLETYNSFAQLYKLQFTQKEIVVKLRGSLDLNYPPKTKLPDEPTLQNPDGSPKDAAVYKAERAKWEVTYLNNHKGTLQHFIRIFNAPDELKKLCLEKLDGKRKWPTNAELTELMALYEDEVKKDTTGFLNQSNPGPAFNKAFEELKKVKAEGEADGTLRGKTTAMMNANQVRDLESRTKSVLLKRMIQIIQRKVNIVQLDGLDLIAMEVQKHLTPEQTAALAGMQKPSAKDDEETADEQEQEEPSESMA